MIIHYEATIIQQCDGELELNEEEEAEFRRLEPDQQEDFVRELVHGEARFNVAHSDLEWCDWRAEETD